MLYERPERRVRGGDGGRRNPISQSKFKKEMAKLNN